MGRDHSDDAAPGHRPGPTRTKPTKNNNMPGGCPAGGGSGDAHEIDRSTMRESDQPRRWRCCCKYSCVLRTRVIVGHDPPAKAARPMSTGKRVDSRGKRAPCVGRLTEPCVIPTSSREWSPHRRADPTAVPGASPPASRHGRARPSQSREVTPRPRPPKRRQRSRGTLVDPRRAPRTGRACASRSTFRHDFVSSPQRRSPRGGIA